MGRDHIHMGPASISLMFCTECVLEQINAVFDHCGISERLQQQYDWMQFETRNKISRRHLTLGTHWLLSGFSCALSRPTSESSIHWRFQEDAPRSHQQLWRGGFKKEGAGPTAY